MPKRKLHEIDENEPENSPKIPLRTALQESFMDKLSAICKKYENVPTDVGRIFNPFKSKFESSFSRMIIRPTYTLPQILDYFRYFIKDQRAFWLYRRGEPHLLLAINHKGPGHNSTIISSTIHAMFPDGVLVSPYNRVQVFGYKPARYLLLRRAVYIHLDDLEMPDVQAVVLAIRKQVFEDCCLVRLKDETRSDEDPSDEDDDTQRGGDPSDNAAESDDETAQSDDASSHKEDSESDESIDEEEAIESGQETFEPSLNKRSLKKKL